MRLQVILQPNLVDQAAIRLQPINMLFLGFEYVFKQFTRHIVADCFALSDGFLEQRQRLVLQFQVALESLGNIFTDVQFSQVLQVWNTVEEEDVFGEPVRVLHRVD